jgi:Transposase domain (DUF772)
MSLHSTPIPPVPDETVRVAQAAFPRGNALMQMREVLGTIYRDEQCADLFPVRGQPAAAPWRLALVTVFQFMERLPDRPAADAVRRRLDWKYALSLDRTDPGFDHTVLSEFRFERVPLASGSPRSRRAAIGRDAGAVHGAWLAQRAGAPANRFHPCVGYSTRPQSVRALNRYAPSIGSSW